MFHLKEITISLTSIQQTENGWFLKLSFDLDFSNRHVTCTQLGILQVCIQHN